MTQARDSYKASNTDFTTIPNASGFAINAGDMVCANSTTAYQASGLSTTGLTQYFVGVSQDTYPVPNNYSNQPELPVTVVRAGRVTLVAKNGDTFTPYAPVWPAGIDNQTVTVTSGSIYPVGTVANLEDNSQQSLLGTGSNYVQIDIRAKNSPTYNI